MEYFVSPFQYDLSSLNCSKGDLKKKKLLEENVKNFLKLLFV